MCLENLHVFPQVVELVLEAMRAQDEMVALRFKGEGHGVDTARLVARYPR